MSWIQLVKYNWFFFFLTVGLHKYIQKIIVIFLEQHKLWFDNFPNTDRKYLLINDTVKSQQI